MPFGYGTKTRASKHRKRPRRTAGRKPRVTVKARPRRVAVATQRQLMRLTKQVKFNTQQAMGDLQKSTQRIIWNTGTESDRYVTVQTPHAIWHQGITERTAVRGLRRVLNPPGPDTLNALIPGTWRNFGLLDVLQGSPNNPAFDADLVQYDNQRQYAASLGVQSKYVHYYTDYCFNFNAVNCTGYYSIHLVQPRRSMRPITAVPNIQATTYNVEQGLQGLCGMCPGSTNEYKPNPAYFKCKLLKRGYYNTAFNANESQLNTNPNFQVRIRLRNPRGKKLIIFPESQDQEPPIPAQCPVHQQMWLIVSSSIEQPQSTLANHLKYHCVKTNVWRDYLGASH